MSNPYDIFAPEAVNNHVLYDRMRRDDPIHRAIDPHTGQTCWFLTAYAPCVDFMRDKRFGKEFRSQMPPGFAVNTTDMINRHMLNLDDPDHARLKSLVHRAFTPARVHQLRHSIQTIANQLLDTVDREVAEGDEFDLVERYAGVLPLMAIADMLGIPAADYPHFSAWTKTLLFPADQTALHRAVLEFSMYLHHQIDYRHNYPQSSDDLLMGLIFAEEAGDRLTRHELLAMIFLLLSAGHETMVSFLSNSLLSLMENPDQMQLLRDQIDDEITIKSAVEEMLRYNGPSYMTLPSWALEDVEIGGKLIGKGDTVHAILSAANRDPAVFSQPHRFDILRTPNKHLAFSQGIHHCLGAPLARLEGEIGIATLLRRIPEL